MNETTSREIAVRRLTRQMSHTRQVAAQLAVLRESTIREFGLAHPRSIAVSRRLTWTMSVHRSLQQRLRQAASDQERSYRREHPGSWQDHHQR